MSEKAKEKISNTIDDIETGLEDVRMGLYSSVWEESELQALQKKLDAVGIEVSELPTG